MGAKLLILNPCHSCTMLYMFFGIVSVPHLQSLLHLQGGCLGRSAGCAQ